MYRLFDSWEPDAVVMDRECGIYADWRKVHRIHFEGEVFKWHRQLGICRLMESAIGLAMRDYAAIAMPVTSAQVAKAWVRSDRRLAAVS